MGKMIDAQSIVVATAAAPIKSAARRTCFKAVLWHRLRAGVGGWFDYRCSRLTYGRSH